MLGQAVAPGLRGQGPGGPEQPPCSLPGSPHLPHTALTHPPAGSTRCSPTPSAWTSPSSWAAPCGPWSGARPRRARRQRSTWPSTATGAWRRRTAWPGCTAAPCSCSSGAWARCSRSRGEWPGWGWAPGDGTGSCLFFLHGQAGLSSASATNHGLSPVEAVLVASFASGIYWSCWCILGLLGSHVHHGSTHACSSTDKAALAYAIATDHGCVWDMKFCPSGAWEPPDAARQVGGLQQDPRPWGLPLVSAGVSAHPH